MCFKYVEEINREINDPQDLKPIKQTRKLYSVQSVGKRFEIDVRYSSCCCVNCMKGNFDKCIYTNYVGQWNRNCLKKDGKSVRKRKSFCKMLCKKENQNQVKRYMGKQIKKCLIMEKERIARIIGNILLGNEQK